MQLTWLLQKIPEICKGSRIAKKCLYPNFRTHGQNARTHGQNAKKEFEHLTYKNLMTNDSIHNMIRFMNYLIISLIIFIKWKLWETMKRYLKLNTKKDIQCS